MIDFIDIYKNLISYRTRESLKSVEQHARIVTGADYLDCCQYITGKNDWQQIHDLHYLRDGTQIVSKSEDTFSDTTYAGDQFYAPPMIARHMVSRNVIARPGEYEKYESNLLPTVVTGVAQSILKTIACLFNSSDNKFQFTNDTGDVEAIEELIWLHRKSGGFENAINNTDFVSSGIQSSILHVFTKGDWLEYCNVWPSSIYLVYGEKITETSKWNGNVSRFADTTDLEDASAVIICMGSYGGSSVGTQRVWLAYVGANDSDPYGRMVTYHQDQAWPIPEITDRDKIIVENLTVSGQRANPLTYVNRTFVKHGIGGGFDYPIAIIKGDSPFVDSEVLPVSDTFKHNCENIEYLWSGIADNIRRCARGKDIFSLSVSATRLPSSLDVIVCPEGVTHTYIPGNASGLQMAVDSLVTLERGVASSRGVPPYIIVGPVVANPESGVSLAIQTAPLIDARSARIKTNMKSVERIFPIEQALLASINQETVSFLAETRCTWNPGEYKIPQDRTTLLSNLKMERDLETKDQVQVFKEANSLSTDQEAIDAMKILEERDPQYTGLQKAPEPAQDQFAGGGNMIEKNSNGRPT